MPDPTNIPVPVTSRQVTVTGVNLFDLASLYLNDATRWNDIAEANDIIPPDPFIQGTVTLNIPSGARPGNGGVWGV